MGACRCHRRCMRTCPSACASCSRAVERLRLRGVDSQLAEQHAGQVAVARLELAMCGYVDRDALPVLRPALLVANEHRAAVEPYDAAVGTQDPELLVERLARLLAV